MENIQVQQKKKKKGFTLIELIIVMAILGILALIAIPKFSQARKDAKVNADFASAKTIANATSTLLASEKITLGDDGTATIVLPNDGKAGDNTNQKAIMDRISDAEKVCKPQALDGGNFSVSITKDGDVIVKVQKSSENTTKEVELYPTQERDKYQELLK